MSTRDNVGISLDYIYPKLTSMQYFSKYSKRILRICEARLKLRLYKKSYLNKQKKTFDMQNENKTFPYKDYMKAKHVQSQSTDKNSTNFRLKEKI